ncbi:hypothetical protein [Cerasicoccus fimbriatus]|uniref:hypothetical protein n=1 Tax=Cerasicoccus fimbriatus TaxID=3014554 RepID=UPI0022B39535|nr:hypothetical protein [Cerasicoccus sp. TK19100]
MKKAFRFILKVVAVMLFACAVFVVYPRTFEGKYYCPMLVQGVRERHWVVTEKEIILIRDSMEGEVSDSTPFTWVKKDNGMREIEMGGQRYALNKGFNYWYFSFEPLIPEEPHTEGATFYRLPI